MGMTVGRWLPRARWPPEATAEGSSSGRRSSGPLSRSGRSTAQLVKQQQVQQPVLLPQGELHDQQQQQVPAAADAADAVSSSEDESEGSEEAALDVPSEEDGEKTVEEFLAGEHEVFTTEDLQQQDQQEQQQQQQQQQQHDASLAAAAAVGATLLAGSSGSGVPGALGWQSSVASVTADFAMQNVLLQMGLRLLTRDGRRIARLSRWGLGGGQGRSNSLHEALLSLSFSGICCLGCGTTLLLPDASDLNCLNWHKHQCCDLPPVTTLSHLVSLPDHVMSCLCSRYALRCSACFTVTREAGRLFCPKCGNLGLDRVEVVVGETGRSTFGVKKRHILRGTKFSLPKPRVSSRVGSAGPYTDDVAHTLACTHLLLHMH